MKHLIFTLVLLGMSTLTLGATFCVGDAAALQNALNVAENNGEDDSIRIKSGDYLTPNGQPFRFDNNEAHDLSISGGWSDFGQLSCFNQIGGDPYETTLDGNNATPVLWLTNNGHDGVDISVSDLSIINGDWDQPSGNGGLWINHYSQANTGSVLVDRMYFAGNDSGGGSALRIAGDHQFVVRNSVFSNNTTTGSGVVNLNTTVEAKGVHFINNTLMNNQTTSSSTTINNTSGLYVVLNEFEQDIPQALVANNLFWDNQVSDFYLGANGVLGAGGLTFLYNNNFEGGYADGIADQANNSSLPPMLSQFILDFTPQFMSPLIDRGLVSLPNTVPPGFAHDWDPGTQDFDDVSGALTQSFGRVVNNRLDIGALEAGPETPIFKDGFE